RRKLGASEELLAPLPPRPRQHMAAAKYDRLVAQLVVAEAVIAAQLRDIVVRVRRRLKHDRYRDRDSNRARQRDEAIAEALAAGRALGAVRKEFGINTAELDAALERLWPIDAVARLRMIKSDLGKLDRLTQVFYEKALGGCIQSGLLTVRIWERKHELLGMNAAAKFEVVTAPPEAPPRHEKIRA